jgi:alpha-D-glucose phosphate-specific phosphoglucomutase
MNRIKFGTDGWRAVMAEDFTYDNVRNVAQALANYLVHNNLDKRGVILGYDTRFSSDLFARAIAEVLAGNEARVFVAERDIPTPVVAFSVKDRVAGGGVVVTASHNGPEWNGIKFLSEHGAPAPTSVTDQIETQVMRVREGQEIKRADYERAQKTGLIQKLDPAPAYFKHVKSIVDFDTIRKGGLTIVYDALWGSGRAYLDVLLREAGVKTRVLHNYRDPLFGGAAPDILKDNLLELESVVRESEADLGVATDGDAVRYGIIDSLGNYITPNEVASLIFLHLVKRRKFEGIAVRTVATTHLIDRIAAKYSVDVVEVPVGFKHVGERMLKENVIIGAEESGGLTVLGHMPEKDGILAALLTAEIQAIEKKPLSTLVKMLHDEVGALYSKRVDVKLRDDEHKTQVMSRLKIDPPAQIGTVRVASSSEIDGLKFLLKDGSWVLVRPAGTEPLLRVYLEATSQDMLKRLEKFANEVTR